MNGATVKQTSQLTGEFTSRRAIQRNRAIYQNDARGLASSFPSPASGKQCETLAFERRIAHLRHPLSRWYVCPLAAMVARRLRDSRVRPNHVTLAGLAVGLLAAVILASAVPSANMPFAGASFAIAGMCVWLAWFCDRLDGALARAQGTASAAGARLDALTDELTDVLWHAALAAGLAAIHQAVWPWWLALAFVAGKYLMFRGQRLVESARPAPQGDSPDGARPSRGALGFDSRLRRLARLPGNADVRLHLLLVALLLSPWVSWLPAVELMLVAVYYNLRWSAHFLLHARGERSGK